MCAAPAGSRALIYHPVLDRTVEVPARTVRIYERSGWQAVDELKPSFEPDWSPAVVFDPFADEPVDDPSPSEGEFPESPDQEV